MLHPCGVTLSVALFGKGRRVQTPLSPILPYFAKYATFGVERGFCSPSRAEPNFYRIFLCLLLYYHVRFAKGH